MENMKTDTQKPTILIVDDMATNITLLSNLLRDDYIIQIANNGKKALDIARGTKKPDLILLDIEMPEMNGYEVCKELKNNAQTKNIPIIFVTARNHVKDEEYGFNLGAVDYISKPFHPIIVKIRVKNHVNLKIRTDFLESISMIDGLTQIYNRRYFDEEYKRTCDEMARENKMIALMMIDVDYFKAYNDHYGHGRGDECLIKIAATLKSALKRPSDILARYGGEEFIVMLQDIDKEGAMSVAQALLQAIRELNIPHEYSSVADHVTISLGVALQAAKEIKHGADFLKIADDAMYRAKTAGRDRIEI